LVESINKPFFMIKPNEESKYIKELKDCQRFGDAVRVMLKNLDDYTDDEILQLYEAYDDYYYKYLRAKYF